jgi:ribonuclease BN (tRNA processing enzyme)
MNIKVLGCSGAEFPDHHPPSFLMAGKILFDAGSITNVLWEKDQLKIKNIFVTHAHLDHIIGIPFLADNILNRNKHSQVDIFGISPVIKAIKKSLLNGIVWPDFTVIPLALGGILRLRELKPGKSIRIDSYSITPFKVNHSVPAVGYLVEDEKKRRFFYTGDTGPSNEIWKKIGAEVHCLILEVTFPNEMEKEAIRTGHLTPWLLRMELSKMKHVPKKIWVTHVKPQYFETIHSELGKLGVSNLRLLKDGETIKV